MDDQINVSQDVTNELIITCPYRTKPLGGFDELNRKTHFAPSGEATHQPCFKHATIQDLPEDGNAAAGRKTLPTRRGV